MKWLPPEKARQKKKKSHNIRSLFARQVTQERKEEETKTILMFLYYARFYQRYSMSLQTMISFE